MKGRHPRALEKVPGNAPSKVDVGDATQPVDAEGCFHAREQFFRRLADRFGVEYEALKPGAEPESEPTAEEQIDAGTCPWCDEYEGEGVAQHASSAHPEAWESYKEATED